MSVQHKGTWSSLNSGMGVQAAVRPHGRRLLRSRLFKILLLFFILTSAIDVLYFYRNITDGEREAALRRQKRWRMRSQPERVYITAMHYNDVALLSSHWVDSLLNLTETLGKKNVFVSVYESGSWDGTKDWMRYLNAQLEWRGVPHNVVIEDWTHQDEIDQGLAQGRWVETRGGGKAVRRIPFLAGLRNKALKDLAELKTKGVSFDKVLFLNDVVFTADDVVTLMDTNGGDYAAACSLDFSAPPDYYDTFALRDTEGDTHIMQTWPYFRPGRSRNALMKNMDAVPVTSCWNGMVVMPSQPFVSSTQLRFRAVPDSLAVHHVEASECCLIHADNPLSKTLGVYLNPRVRVGYDGTAYEATHPAGSWVSPWRIFLGVWGNRIRGWASWAYEDSWAKRTVENRVDRWEKAERGNHEPGNFCLVNEMQVLVDNGWAHV